MSEPQASNAPRADAIADCHVSLAVAAGCSAIGVGGFVANAIFPGITAVDGLLLVGGFYAAIAATTWFFEIRAAVDP